MIIVSSTKRKKESGDERVKREAATAFILRVINDLDKQQHESV
jgi:hypothetical protein